RYRAVAGGDARGFRARADRSATRRRQSGGAGRRQSTGQPLSRRQPGSAPCWVSAVGHQSSRAAIVRDGGGHADVRRSRSLPPEADDPEGRHVRKSPAADLFGAGRRLATCGSGRVRQGLVEMSGARTTTLAETIRQRLADDILRGVYPPGTRLDEIGLAKRFKL